MTALHLSVDTLRKAFAAKEVLNDVSFSVAQGEMLSILGPSGCGKSTLLRVLAGLLREDRGTIRIAGKSMAGVPPRDRGIGFVFQDYALFPKMTVRDNVAFGLRVRGVPIGDRNRKASEMLELVGLAEEADRPVDTLSGGQKRRVSIAISMVHNPKLIFLDEPTSGLDPLARYELWEYLDLINKEYGITLCVISHYLDEIEYCDKAAIFLSGVGFYAFGSPQNLKAQLPGGGNALEITLEAVSMEAVDLMRKVEGADFVIQRGERVRILSNLPSKEIADRVLKALEEKNVAVHQCELKVAIDMIDYFTYVSALQHAKVEKKEIDLSKEKRN